MKYETNYKGYFYINRAVLKAIISKYHLTFSQVGAFIYFISQIDFHIGHKHYQKLIRDDVVIAESLGINPSTIYKQRKELIRKQVFVIENGVTTYPYFFLFRLEYSSLFVKHNAEQIQSIFEDPQETIERITKFSEKSHKIEAKIANFSNLPSKDDLSFSEDDIKLIEEGLEGGEDR